VLVKVTLILKLKFSSKEKTKSIALALRPDNLLTKENMVIVDKVHENIFTLKIDVTSENINNISTIRNTADEILAHIKSLENLFEKVKDK